MYSFRPVKQQSEIDTLRNLYLDQLVEAQEYYLELLIREARVVAICHKHVPVGYFIVNSHSVLLEFFINMHHQQATDFIFDRLINRYGIRGALCKSFDFTCLHGCLDHGVNMEVVGLHFRDYQPSEGRFDAAWDSMQPAHDDMIHAIISMGDGLFDGVDEIHDLMAREALWVFFNDGQLIACGLCQPVIPGREHYDVGMAVHKAHRGKGIGSAVVRTMIQHVEEQGGTPVAGCDVKNSASKRTLERAGFYSRHRLLKFAF